MYILLIACVLLLRSFVDVIWCIKFFQFDKQSTHCHLSLLKGSMITSARCSILHYFGVSKQRVIKFCNSVHVYKVVLCPFKYCYRNQVWWHKLKNSEKDICRNSTCWRMKWKIKLMFTDKMIKITSWCWKHGFLDPPSFH